jgi:hypothetical protein
MSSEWRWGPALVWRELQKIRALVTIDPIDGRFGMGPARDQGNVARIPPVYAANVFDDLTRGNVRLWRHRFARTWLS